MPSETFKHRRPDALFLWLTGVLLVFGFIIFASASVGLIAREGAQFPSIAVRQLVAIGIGIAVAYGISRMDYRRLQRYSLPLLLFSIGASLLVFVPGIGISHGGAYRWIALGSITFQPSELLKIAFVIYAASYLSAVKEKVTTFSRGLLPVLVLLSVSGTILLRQPDTDTFAVLAISIIGIFFSAGARLKHLGIIALMGAIGLSVLVMERPYLKERMTTFLNPSADPRGAGYQIQQSLIAIGSGGFWGKGFGQGVQKFAYLPEPVGDSIFAVAGEEFGFVGSFALILLFAAFILRGFKIAVMAVNRFAGLVTIGIVILISASAFLNIAAMLGLIPLSGLPLSFVSHGGTALFFAVIGAGIVVNISRYQKQY